MLEKNYQHKYKKKHWTLQKTKINTPNSALENEAKTKK